jgi:hypothetical protein
MQDKRDLIEITHVMIKDQIYMWKKIENKDGRHDLEKYFDIGKDGREAGGCGDYILLLYNRPKRCILWFYIVVVLYCFVVCVCVCVCVCACARVCE